MNSLEEALAEIHHFKQATTHNRSFCVVTPAKTIHPASSDSYDVFQRTAKRYTSDIRNHTHVKVSSMEQRLPSSVIDGRIFCWQRLELDL